MDPFLALVVALTDRQVPFVVIGVWGANYYARSASLLFTTQDRDLFLRPDVETVLRAWQACEGLTLWSGSEPLEPPHDRQLAERVVGRRALVRASDGRGLDVDLGLTMAGFDFEFVWEHRRVFIVEGVQVPVARLAHIVASKAATGREKDRLFLVTHAEALSSLVRREEP